MGAAGRRSYLAGRETGRVASGICQPQGPFGRMGRSLEVRFPGREGGASLAHGRCPGPGFSGPCHSQPFFREKAGRVRAGCRHGLVFRALGAVTGKKRFWQQRRGASALAHRRRFAASPSRRGSPPPASARLWHLAVAVVPAVGAGAAADRALSQLRALPHVTAGRSSPGERPLAQCPSPGGCSLRPLG